MNSNGSFVASGALVRIYLQPCNVGRLGQCGHVVQIGRKWRYTAPWDRITHKSVFRNDRSELSIVSILRRSGTIISGRSTDDTAVPKIRPLSHPRVTQRTDLCQRDLHVSRKTEKRSRQVSCYCSYTCWQVPFFRGTML